MDGLLRARVAARAVDGAANEALRRLLAHDLDVAPGRVRIVTGETSRMKVIELDGVPPGTVRARWPGLDV